MNILLRKLSTGNILALDKKQMKMYLINPNEAEKLSIHLKSGEPITTTTQNEDTVRDDISAIIGHNGGFLLDSTEISRLNDATGTVLLLG